MRKKITWLVGAVVALLVATGVFAACGGKNLQFPPYEYDYSTPVEEFGDGIRIDGKLDESIWSGRKYLTADIKNTPAKYRMTSYFGEKGVYFAFDIADNAVYYNADREIYANSGVEFCVGSPSDNRITYEIDLNAGGKRMLRKYTGQPYTNWFSDLHSAVSVQGEINTPSCTGYTAEIYLPYALFNADGSDTKLDTLLVNPAIIRANSASGSMSDVDRLWYSIGEQERGLGWAPAAPNWYNFDANGLVCYDVALTASAFGAISGKPYILTDETYILTVEPDAGYYLESLTHDTKDVTDKLTYSGGKAVYSFIGTGDTAIEAKFAPLPETKYTLHGTVSAEGALPETVSLYAAYGGTVTQIPIGADGAYRVDLPAASYTLYCEASGYLTFVERADLTGSLSKNVLLRKRFLGAHTVIGSASNDSSWDFSALGQGTAVSVDNGWLVSTNHTTLMGEKMFVSGDIVLPMRDGVDRRAGFRFVDRSGNGLYVCLLAENESNKNKYVFQVISLRNANSDSWLYGAELTDPIIRTLAHGDGVPFAALCENGKTTVWINGVKILDKFSESVPLNADSEVVPGLTTCGGGSFHNLVFNTTGYDEGYPVTITAGSGGAVTCDKEFYQDGDTLTFTFTPDPGFAVAEVNVNGVDKFSELVGNTLVVQTRGLVAVQLVARFVRVQGERGVLSGTVTAAGAPVSGVPVTLSNANGDTFRVQTANGAFAFEAVDAGVWQLSIDADGYRPYSQRVEIGGDKQIEIELFAVSMADKYVLAGGENYDVEAIESERKVVYTGGGDATLTLKPSAAAGEDVYVSAVVRKQDTFTMNDSGGIRYGFAFMGAGRTLNFNYCLFTYDNNYYASLVDWGVVDTSKALSAKQVAAWETTGLRIAAARINGTFYMFAEEDGIMRVVASGAHKDLADTVINIGFGTWWQTARAEYTEVEWTIGDVAIDVDIQPAEHGTVTVGAEPTLGGDVTVTAKPNEGYLLSSLTVNGEEKLSALEEKDGAYRLTLRGYTDTKQIVVQATFVEQGAFAVALGVKLHKYGIGADNLDFIPDGVTVELRGLTTYRADAVGGKVDFESVEKGAYTVWVDGYRSASLTVTGAVDDTVTLEYDLIDSTANIDTTDANNGNVTLNINSNDAVLFKQTVGASEDFYVSAVFKNVDKDATSLRFGFYIWSDVDGDGQENSDWDGTERIYAPICYQWHAGERQYVMQWIPTWSGYFMSEADADAMAGETGVRLGLARVGGTFFMLREVDGKMKIVSQFPGDTKNYAERAIRVGIITMGAEGATETTAKFSELQFETAANGAFTVAAYADALHTYTNLMCVTDPATTFKTAVGKVVQGQVDVDLSKFAEENGQLVWTNDTAGETVYFKNAMTDLTLDYTLKADIPLRGRVTAFSVFDGAAPFVVSISHETNEDGSSNGYHVQLIRHWNWDNGVYATLTDVQMNKMKTEGLAIRIVRAGAKIEVYADEVSGETVNLAKVAERTYTDNPGPGHTGCGIGVSGSAATFSHITLSNVA